MADQATGLTLPRLALLARRAWPVILLTTFIGAGSAYIVSEREIPLYESTASVYFSLRQGGSGSELNQGSAYTQAQILSFATLATSSITLDRVIDDLDLDISTKDLARNVAVTIPQNTVVLDMTVSSQDPRRAAAIANSVASNLSQVVVDLAPDAENDDAAVSATVIEPAVAAAVQSSPSASRDTALGAILGFLIGAVGCILFALLDTRVRSAEVVRDVTSVPLLGQVGRFAKSADARPAMLRDPNSLDAEAFRRVRAALPFTSVDQEFRAVLVTSGSPGEGKTTLAVNLALAFGESGARVLLMDADLRRPRVANALGVEGAVGLTTILVGTVDQDDAVRQYGSTNLDLLLSGTIPPNPAELLSSMAMAQLIAEFASQYDMVVIDTAPVLSVADATLLSQHVDLTLLVVDASKTRKAQLVRTVGALEIAGAYISGMVLNRAKSTRKRDVYHYGTSDSGSGQSRLSKLNPFRRADSTEGWITARAVAPRAVPASREVVLGEDVTPAKGQEITPAERPRPAGLTSEFFTEAHPDSAEHDAGDTVDITEAASEPGVEVGAEEIERGRIDREGIDPLETDTEETVAEATDLEESGRDLTNEPSEESGITVESEPGQDPDVEDGSAPELAENQASLSPATPRPRGLRGIPRRPLLRRPSVDASEQRQGEA